MVAVLGIFLLFIALLPYVIYFIGISTRGIGSNPLHLDVYPKISIIMPAFNEDGVIKKRIDNILDSTYPRGNYEVILVNDCSTDRTVEIAKESFEKHDVEYQILSNEIQSGPSNSINRAIKQASSDIIVTTDADVFFEKNALEALIARLMSDEEIAAVCGELQPTSGSQTIKPGAMEGTYRHYYGRMCEWESSLDSTYNFNGALIAFKKPYFSKIDALRGADDANTAFMAIRKGYRAVYEINSIVFEEIPDNFKTQYKQKVRRATGLIEATLMNLDLLRMNRLFSRVIYPLRIFMLILSPVLFIFGISLIFIGILLFNPLLAGFIIILIAGSLFFKPGNIFTSFMLNQVYLLFGLLNLGKDVRKWESTSKKGEI
jgi:biofilm PGA synthesis N-glycosyltransferase PgaC